MTIRRTREALGNVRQAPATCSESRRVASRHGSPSGAEIDTNTTPWSEATRAKHRQSDYCRQHDLTDEEWRHVAPLIPAQGRMGRPRSTDSRRVFDALSAGAGGRARPVPAQAGEPISRANPAVRSKACPRAGGGTLVETMSNPCRQSPSMLDRRRPDCRELDGPPPHRSPVGSAASSPSSGGPGRSVSARRVPSTSKDPASVPSSGSPSPPLPVCLPSGPRPPRVV